MHNEPSIMNQNRIGLVFDDRYLAHNPGLYLILDQRQLPVCLTGAHYSSAEQVGRAKHLMDLAGVTDLMIRIEPYEASDEALLVFHTPDYLRRVGEIARTGGETGEGAPIGVGGDRIARLSAGGAMAAVDAVATGMVNKAYALIRPPGHHAMADFGMGFCVFNNVVIAARHAQRTHGLQKSRDHRLGCPPRQWNAMPPFTTTTVFSLSPCIRTICIRQIRAR